MNLLVLTRAVKIDQPYGIPESGISERAFVKSLTGVPLLSPLPHPLVVVVLFSAHISLRCPHDLNAWNRLHFFYGYRNWYGIGQH